VDRRLPVRPLTFAWHRWGWPPIESIAGRSDIVQSLHPLLIPSRRARQAITIHDLHFLAHPERTAGEMRRDYAGLVRDHARRAALVVVNSNDTAAAVRAELSVPADRLVVCRPGVPSWIGRPAHRRPPRDGYVLFVGTLEPRKNLGVLLDAWEQVGAAGPVRLRIAGAVTPGGEPWRQRIHGTPLARSVDYAGYVPDEGRRALYEGARLLVMPSLHEGFGLPVLEAMAMGIPVITSGRGALSEVAGDAGLTVDPGDSRGLADAIHTLLTDAARADALGRRGVERAATFTWATAARALVDAYRRVLTGEAGRAHRH
jgi:glycosyltransferase involved in cell wall biosynthesis